MEVNANYLLGLVNVKYNFDDLSNDERVFCFNYAKQKRKLRSYYMFFNAEINLEDFVNRIDGKRRAKQFILEPVAAPVKRNREIPYHIEMKNNGLLIDKIKQIMRYQRELGNFMVTDEFKLLSDAVRNGMEKDHLMSKLWIVNNIIE